MAYGMKSKKVVYRRNAFSEEEYYKIGKRKGLSGEELQNYVKFMQKRFPTEWYTPYAEEWADRFKSGQPEAWMDDYSLESYKQVKK